MKVITSIIVLLALTISLVQAAEQDVLVLTDKNFDEVINQEELILVEFYAPWCGHCKKLAPKYEEAAGILAKNNPPIKLAKVDCTVETATASKFGISGYPTLKVFRNGSPSEYKGNRETDGIVSYMKKNAGPSAKPLNSLEDAKKYVNYAGDISVVGVFDKSDTEGFNAFLKNANSLREEFRFGVITDAAIAKELGLSNGITVIRDSKNRIAYSSSNDGQLSDFLHNQATHFPNVVTKDTIGRYTKQQLPVLKLYADVNYDKNPTQTTYFLNRLKKIAEEAFKGKLLFALADRSAFSDETGRLGLTTFPGVGIEDHVNSQRYPFKEEFSIEKVVQFAKDFIEGKLKPYIKSEPTPTQTGPVTIVTGENFKDIVLDNTKDVLLEMYAPWCGHCKNLAPIYDELATSLKDVENVVIAKMDATANDSPHGKYQAKGYPTILFAPANSKDAPMPYQGARDVKSFTEFLKKNSNSWKVKGEKSEL